MSDKGIEKNTKRNKYPSDLTGLRFGRLVVLEKIGEKEFLWGNPQQKYTETIWKCRCDCGNEIEARRTTLRKGMKSCGCIVTEKMIQKNIGKRFGRLVIIDYAYTKRYGKGSSKTYWRCKCDCGNEKVASLSSMQCGYINSCGCLAKEVREKMAEEKTTHGGYKDRLYWIWHGMKSRCDKDYGHAHYHEKGIKVCEEWANDYAVFREWALANGYDSNADKYQCTIDRIDNSGNYCPENCRWVNMTVQASNTSQNHYLEYDGKRMTVTQWAKEIGIKPGTLFSRIHNGWPIEDILSPSKFVGGKNGRYIKEREEKV